ncbi:MAG TPA: glycosyltransferase [Candidatus Saccharimonadales bacterium]|jgi:glycosyltransferase involved in cell wall biosynthesis|nr:glycosyltransferase [Candidatus Saccharimonadales bacterium]
MKVVIITCYKQPDYVRAKTLRRGLATNKDVELIVVKNTQTGILKYPEVLWKLLKVRLQQQPDVYLLTFRGYEMLPFTLLLAGRKPVIYDEFINPVLVVNEHRSQKTGVVKAAMSVWSIFGSFYYWLIRNCALILTDTQAHAEYTSQHSGIAPARYRAIPVSTDEELFKPRSTPALHSDFQIFYYGNMLPLHGLTYVLQAAMKLQAYPDISFVLIGGDTATERQVREASENGAHITYKKWVPFNELPQIIHQSDLCLGGPFGNTTQSQVVVTGKTYQFLAAGVPTLVGKTLSSAAFVNKDNCLVVPQGDSQALADTIVWAYRHRRNLPAIGTRGRATYQQLFSNKAVAADLKQILDQLL